MHLFKVPLFFVSALPHYVNVPMFFVSTARLTMDGLIYQHLLR